HMSAVPAAGGANAGGADNGGLWVPDGGVVEHANGPQFAGGGQPGQFTQHAAMYQGGAQVAPGGAGASMPQQAGASLASQVAAAASAGAAPQAPDFAGRVPRYRDVVREQLRTWRTRQAEASEQAARQAAADAATPVTGPVDPPNAARTPHTDSNHPTRRPSS